MPMSAESVVEILTLLERASVRYWVDGGWGVDALVGEQSRAHDDLDLVVPWEDLDRLHSAMRSQGFVMFQDEMPCSFVLGKPGPSCGKVEQSSLVWKNALRVDVHPVKEDSEGDFVQAQPDGGTWAYPRRGLLGRGKIGGMSVPCLTAEVQVLCHDGYELDADDLADMYLLRDRLGVELPERMTNKR